MSLRRLVERASVPVGILCALGIFALAPVGGDAATMLAITVFCIVLWITTPVPPAVTGLLCVGLVGVSFSPSVALTGFRSPAVWLIVFGLFLGEAARRSGLVDWVSDRVLGYAWPTAKVREAEATSAYRRLLTLFGLLAIGLTVLIPSALVRILLLAPVVASVGNVFESERARTGLFLGPLLATFYASPGVFTAGLPNVIASGIAESLGGTAISWSTWTVQMFPLMGLARGLLVTAVVYGLYRPPRKSSVSAQARTVASTGDEGRMMLFLLTGVCFWTTDFLHGLSPVFGALLVVLLALAPRVGVVSLDDLADVDLSIIFFLGAVFAIGNGLSRTGFTTTTAKRLLEVVPDGAALPVVLFLVFGVTVALSFLMEGLAVAAVLTPVLVSFTQNAGLPLPPVVMIEAIALGTFFFPYQSAPLVAIVGEDVVSTGQLIRTTVWASVLSTLVLLPLQVGLFALLY